MSMMRPEGGWNVTRPPVHPGEMLREEFMKPWDFDQRTRPGTARTGHTSQRNCQRTRRNHGRYGLASSAALWHERRFLDEYTEGLRINCDRQRSLKAIEKEVRQRIVAA